MTNKLFFLPVVAIILIFSCNNNPKLISKQIVFDSLSITGNKELDKNIIAFANKVEQQDKVWLFKIYISRKSESARVTVIPIRKLYDSSYESPYSIKKIDEKVYLLYSGIELLVQPTNEIVERLKKIKETLPNELSSIYDSPILQFEVFSPINIQQIIPPQSIYEQPDSNYKIEFKPLHK